MMCVVIKITMWNNVRCDENERASDSSESRDWERRGKTGTELESIKARKRGAISNEMKW